MGTTAETSACEARLNVLVLYTLPTDAVAETIRSSLRAFESFSRHRIYYTETMLGGLAHLELSRFDAIVIHYSIIVALPYREDYLPDFKQMARFQGVKAVFIQDDYRWVNSTVDSLTALGVDILFTCVSESDYLNVYDDVRLANVRIVSIFAGHVDQRLLERTVPPYAQRRIDVGYRAQNLTGKFAWLGELAQEKKWIADRFLENAGSFGLTVDISCDADRRLHGDDWFDFMAGCKAVLGTESGASICDKTGEIEQATSKYLLEHPHATFQEVRDACFAGKDFVTPVRSLSPRVFEAAALRSLMIFYPGNYGGILQAWRHYVPLEKDHSNMAEVVSVLRDEQRASEIIGHAYQEIACNPNYTEASVVRRFDRELESAMRAKSLKPAVLGALGSYTSFDLQLGLVQRLRAEIAASLKLGEELRGRIKEQRDWKDYYREKLQALKSKPKKKQRRSKWSRFIEKVRLLLRKPKS